MITWVLFLIVVIVIVHSVTVQVTVTSSCEGLLLEQTSASGIIFTGHGYGSNMDCQWNLVSALIRSKLELTFYIFSTQLDADFLYVYDGDSSSSPLIDKFSGTSLPAPITSSSNKLHLRFTSNILTQLRGFTASYRGRVLFDHTEGNLIRNI